MTIKPGIRVWSMVAGGWGRIVDVAGDRVTITWGVGDDEYTSTMSLDDVLSLTRPEYGIVTYSRAGSLMSGLGDWT